MAKGLRGARARTGLSEEEVVSILARQGMALTSPDLRRAESTGAIGLALAARLADIYGTTTDCTRRSPAPSPAALAGRLPVRR